MDTDSQNAVEVKSAVITEADVVAFLIAQCKRLETKSTGYSQVSVQVSRWCPGVEQYEPSFRVSAGSFSKIYSSTSLDGAITAAEAETPQSLAAAKRKHAAELIAEADALMSATKEAA